MLSDTHKSLISQLATELILECQSRNLVLATALAESIKAICAFSNTPPDPNETPNH